MRILTTNDLSDLGVTNASGVPHMSEEDEKNFEMESIGIRARRGVGNLPFWSEIFNSPKGLLRKDRMDLTGKTPEELGHI
ncbi:MAG: hypothetical protein WC795_01710 [Candidatus Paceibacterota bacterium]|jgi:hypothetical protein